jgi:hypothetical protein
MQLMDRNKEYSALMEMLRQTMYEEIDLLKKRKVIYERLNYIRKIDTPKPNKKGTIESTKSCSRHQ